jgi:hypothetical protein
MYEDIKGRPLFLVDQDTRHEGEGQLPAFHPTVATRGRVVSSTRENLRT